MVGLRGQSAQGWSHAPSVINRFGSDDSEGMNDVVVDASGNIIVAGYVRGTSTGRPVYLDPNSNNATHTGIGYDDVSIVKMDSSGNYLWGYVVGGIGLSQGGEQANSVDVDSSGNIYVTGYFYSTVDFDAGPGTANLTATGAQTVFIMKLDASGNFQWVLPLGGNGTTRRSWLQVDSANNVIVAANVVGTGNIDIDPTSGVQNIAGYWTEQTALVKLTSAGALVWAKSFSGAATTATNDLFVDGSDNIIVAGAFTGTIDFDPGAGTASETYQGYNSDAFIVKFDASGQFVYEKALIATAPVEAKQFAVGSNGNIYVGYIAQNASAAIDLDLGSGVVSTGLGAGGFDFYLVAYDSSYNYINHVGGGGGGSPSDDTPVGLTPTSNGELWFSANVYASNIDFDPSAATKTLNAQAVLARYGPNLELRSVVGIYGTNRAVAADVAVDANDDAWLVGTYGVNTNFYVGTSQTTSFSGRSNFDGFLARFDLTNMSIVSSTPITTTTVAPTTTTTTVPPTSTTVASTTTTTAVSTTTTIASTTTTATSTATVTPSTTEAPIARTFVLAPPSPEQISRFFPIGRVTETETAVPGSQLEVEVDGFQPLEIVNAVFSGETKPAASTKASSVGVAKFSISVPRSVSNHRITLAVYSPSTGRGVRQNFTVVKTLTTTGSQALAETQLALAFLLFGMAFLSARRTRRQ
jgi:hypothetical protein